MPKQQRNARSDSAFVPSPDSPVLSQIGLFFHDWTAMFTQNRPQFQSRVGSANKWGKTMLARRVFVFVTLLLLSPPALADDVERFVGNWKLVSFFTEDVQTRQRINLFGEQPTGALSVAPGGRFIVIITAEGRKAPQTPEEQAAAYRTMLAYAGKWRPEGDSFVTHVDVAWNPAWVGTDQARFWKFEGNKFFAITPPIPNPNKAGGMMTVTAVWEKEP